MNNRLKHIQPRIAKNVDEPAIRKYRDREGIK